MASAEGSRNDRAMTEILAGAPRPVRQRPVIRVVAGAAGLVLAGLVAVGSLNFLQRAPLTAAEWDWCQGHWHEGLDPSQRAEPSGSTWYFNHMGMRDNPDTIRVCRAAAAKR